MRNEDVEIISMKIRRSGLTVWPCKEKRTELCGKADAGDGTARKKKRETETEMVRLFEQRHEDHRGYG